MISWVHAGDASEAIDNYPPGWAEEWVEAPRNIHPRAYALRIVGNSMAPEFLPGTIIIVEPEVDWWSGSYVIVKNGDNEVVLRRIVRDMGGWTLEAINPDYKPQPLGSYRVIGAVHSQTKRYR